MGEARTKQAELAIAEQALRDTTIRAPRPSTGAATAGPAADENEAPASGESKQGTFAIAARYVSVGELLSPISRMYRLVDDDPLKMRAPVREQFIGELRVGQRALVRVDAFDRDFTAQVDLRGLPPGQTVFYRASFQDLRDLGVMSEPVVGRFRAPPREPRDLVLAWSADTCGQGYGINPALGGLPMYETLRRARPDVHALRDGPRPGA